VGIDFLQNFKDVPPSANLQLLYLFYNAFFTLTITLPLSLVFGWIITLIVLIKNNEFVALLSIGVRPKNVYLPVVFISFILLIGLIVMQATPLAYAYEQKIRIMDGEYFSNKKNDIFLKYDNNFVYFKRFFPLEKRAEDIHIFKLENDDIVESIVASKAYFQNNRWYIVDAKITIKPSVIDWDNSKVIVKEEKFLHTLEGFKPKIVDNVYEGKANFSIIDAVYAILLLKTQNINTDAIRASLYYQLFVPFFIFPVMIIIFVFTSINSRLFNIAKFSSFTVFCTLILWGLFFMLNKFAKGAVVAPEIALLLPVFVWFIIGYAVYKHRINSY
jgi:lipopolysaccharide export system permease protein